MKDIMFGDKRIASLSESGVATIKKTLSKHLYRKLNAFCINEVLFRNIDIHGFLFSTALVDYYISKQAICEFKEHFNPYISFNGEKQLAFPLIIMEACNKKTGENECGIATTAFVPNGIYSGWITRRAKNV
jgi:hypothetical protein